jgi:ATP-binding cassette subfamily E protein 1
VLDRNVEHLSGGELQRFAIGVVAAQAADVYMIDEPSSYLDVRQRLKAAQVIRGLLDDQQKFVIAVEHDLSVLDYLSDFICCLYGKPGAYGVVTLPFSVREGINIFLAGVFAFLCLFVFVCLVCVVRVCAITITLQQQLTTNN